MSIKDAQDGKCWLEWEEGLKHRNPHDLWLFKEAHYDEVEFWEFLQFEFFNISPYPDLNHIPKNEAY